MMALIGNEWEIENDWKIVAETGGGRIGTDERGGRRDGIGLL